MGLMVIGLNHKTAPVEVRDRLAFSAAALEAALAHLSTCDGIEEVVMLSTCNRTEVYALCEDAQPLVAFLAKHAGLPIEALWPHLYCYEADHAARHLFRVTTGLDSLVVGEMQIAGQVATALNTARGAKTARKVLTGLFQSAVATGKRARTETAISEGVFSVGGVAVELARSLFPDLNNRAVLVLGAGKMSELTARHLANAGANPILVANRTYEHARELADRLEGRAIHYDELGDKLAEIDILISSTGAPHMVLYRDAVERAMPKRQGRPLFLIDIAIPRDIDPEVASIPGAHLYNIDDLSIAADSHGLRRTQEVPRVEAIIDEELGRWRQRFAGMQSAELISALQESYERVRTDEMTRIGATLDSLTSEQRRVIEGMTASLVNKLLHVPIVRLKEMLCHDRNALPLFCELFDLAEEETEERVEI